MKKQRPVNLNLFTIRFPIPAIASILHRISGVLLFFLIPLLLLTLQYSLISEVNFEKLQMCFANLSMKFFIWVVLGILGYHVFAGIRHLIMDLGIGESLRAGRASAVIVFIATFSLVIILGIWLW